MKEGILLEYRKIDKKRQQIRRLIFLLIGIVCIFVGTFVEINRYNWNAISIFLLIVPSSIFVLITIKNFIIYFVKRYNFYSKLETDSLENQEKVELFARKRKENRTTIVIALSIVFVVVSASLIGVYIPKYNDRQWIRANSELAILKNSDFSKKYLLTGSGTIDDPYLIEDLVIKTNKKYGIYLAEISAHFIIRNCTIEANDVGITLLDSADNVGKIHNNTLHILNSFEGSVGGISVCCTSGTIISNNYCFSSTNTTLDKHSTGIFLSNSVGCFITGNVCENLSIGISCTDRLDNLFIVGNTCFNNFNMGINIYAGFWSKGPIKSRNIILSNNKCLNSKTGVSIGGRITNVDVIRNNISYNTDYGITTKARISFCNISYNTIHFNGYGLGSVSFTNSTISFNSFMSNTNYSIEFLEIFLGYTVSNILHHNNFISNHAEGLAIGLKQVLDASYYLNQWFDENTKEGNYWSDLVWNEGVTYEIDWGDEDLYPLENPVSI